MKYPRHILIAIFLVQFAAVSAQVQHYSLKGTFGLKFIPANVFNPELSTLDFAASYFITDTYAVEVRYGKKIGLINPRSDETRFQGHKVFAEVQRIISDRVMVATEVGYSTSREAWHIRYYNSAEEEISDRYYTIKERYSFTPKVIVVLYRKGLFSFETFGGIGIKRVHRIVTDLEFDQSSGDHDYGEYEGFGGGPQYVPLKKTDVRVALGISFSLLLNHRQK